MNARWVTVTPKMAAKFLEKNECNRGLSTSWVHALARDMKANRWGANPQPWVFNQKGAMLDAQHRAAAVVLSGMSVRALIVTGCDHDVRRYLDRTRRRTIADMIRMDGGKYATLKAAASSWLFRIDRGAIGRLRDRATEGEVMEALAAYRTEFEWVDKEAHFHPGFWRHPYVAVVIWAMRVEPDEVKAFHYAVQTGEELKAGDPALALRKYMMDIKGEGGGSQVALELVLKTMTALDAHLARRQVTKLYASRDAHAALLARMGKDRHRLRHIDLDGTSDSRI